MALRISDLGTAPTVEETDLVEIAEVDGESPSGYSSYKTTILGIANKIASGVIFSSLVTTAKNIIGAINEIVNGFDDNVIDVIKDLKQVRSATITDGVATFDDVIEANPLVEATATFSPKQDLHGYDYPWAAGGGKNKIGSTLTYIKSANTSGTWSGNNYTLNGVTFAVLVDSDDNVTGIKVTGTASERTDFRVGIPDLVTGTDYIVNGCPANGSDSTYRLTCLYNPSGSAHDRGSGSITFTATGYEGTYCYIRIANGYSIATGGLTYYPMVRLATETDTTFAPYSNICPISGWDGLNLTRTGKNLLDFATMVAGYVTATGSIGAQSETQLELASDYILVSPNTNYIFSVIVNNNSAKWIGTGFYDIDKNFISRETVSPGLITDLVQTLHTPNNAKYMRVSYRGYGISQKPQVELGSTVTTYEPYNGQTYPATFSDTIYGGSYDFVSGDGSSEWGYIASYNGETLPGVWISDRDVYAEGTTPTTGAEVAYELSTPTPISLTGQEIEALEGVNVVTTDGDGMSSVKYKKMNL